MARYLFTVWPFPGHLNPAIAVAEALRARGHTVAFYTATQTCDALAGLNVAHFAGGEDADVFYGRLVARYAQSHDSTSASRRRTMKTMFGDWILQSVPQQVEELEGIIDRWHPQALVCDPMMWGPYLVLHELRSLPVAILSFFAGCPIPGPDAPPMGLGLPVPRTYLTRAQARLATIGVNVVARGVRRAASAMRQSYGLPALREPVLALGGRMPLYLVTTSPQYDYDRRDLPPSVHYVGPCLWDRSRDSAPPAWLARLTSDRPAVYVTEGTAHSFDAALLQAAARGLAGLDMQVVLTTGGQWRDPARLGLTAVAPNIRVEHFVPHSDLFPHLSAVVTTGGSSTVQAALSAGLPLVIVPREWDQYDNAQRVVEAGAGIRLSARRLTPALLRAAVQRVLREPSFRTNSCRLGDAAARLGGAHRAASLLEDMVRGWERAPLRCAPEAG